MAKGELGLHILDYLAFKYKELNTYIDVNRIDNKWDIILDTRNILNMDALCALGFTYDNVGRVKK